MSLPPELRVLCFQLSNTPTSDLPRLAPALLRLVSRCHTSLSTPVGNTNKAESSTSVQVQVHKLKTQLSTLLNGKSLEGRFTAVVLIKAVVEAGGWEVLRGSELWVRGLLSILGKPDSAATKELCIVALTKIYCMIHPYQTLVREITTPTLPSFVASCLSLLASKSSKTQEVSVSTIEVIFRSFATLLPRHTTIYRPFVSQIRSIAKPYIAATLSDGRFIPSSLEDSARHLIVIMHQTAAKTAGGEEWGKAVRALLKDIHVTADLVFRAVVEDWESTAGYIGEPADFNAELSGGAKDIDDLPRWTGVDAGVERIVGMLRMLTKYLNTETSLPVSIPLGVIVDMITRMLSIAIPSPSQFPPKQGGVQLHPAIDRDERDGLWSGLPQIYVAALHVISTMVYRLQEAVTPIAQTLLDQLAWVFPYGKHDSDFRLHSYRLTVHLLTQTGQVLTKTSVSKCSPIIKSCCNDVINPEPVDSGSGVEAAKKSNGNASNTNQNADLFLQNNIGTFEDIMLGDRDLAIAAKNLLPLFLSHFPQQLLDISLRSLIERTAILSHNKEAMLAGILNPFVGKNGKSMTSILPHLTRAFPNDDAVESLVRPRMPLLPSTTGAHFYSEEEAALEDEDEDMDMERDTDDVNFVDAPQVNTFNANEFAPHGDASSAQDDNMSHPGVGGSSPPQEGGVSTSHHNFDTKTSSNFKKPTQQTFFSRLEGPLTHPPVPIATTQATAGTLVDAREENISDSDDESVHLTMQLDTDSEPEE